MYSALHNQLYSFPCPLINYFAQTSYEVLVISISLHLIRTFSIVCSYHCSLLTMVALTFFYLTIIILIINLADSNNYRPIEIATIVIKSYESTVLYKCEASLNTCDNQFGFKRKHSTEFCIIYTKGIH